MRIAIIACSNGLGHVRRCLLISNELAMRGYEVTLFAPFQHISKFIIDLNRTKFHLYDFSSRTSKKDFLNRSPHNWVKRIPDLDKYDLVISDNLLEILYIRTDAWISGTFFWHESLLGFPEQHKLKINQLLSEFKPNIISSKLLLPDYIKRNENLFEVGLYVNREFSPLANQAKTDLLISGGTGGDIEIKISAFISNLSKVKNVPFRKVWVEPRFCPENRPNWMEIASYSHEMYSSISAAIIRPGVGTITDCLYNGIKLFMFHESDNIEMKSNSDCIERAELGKSFSSLENAWEESIHYFFDSRKIDNFNKKIKELNFDGVKEIADLISNWH